MNNSLKKIWVRDFVRDYLKKNWYRYDIDRNESMDHHEAYEFFIDLVPKTKFEKLGYVEVYNQQNTKGDEQLDRDECYVAIVKLIGTDLSNINTIDQLKKTIVENMK